MDAQARSAHAALNDAQREAVTHVEGPMLVLAGPGSGKTRVVTFRIAHLLEQGFLPRQILALTFTNKAAEEMRNRLVQLGADPSVWVGTFHRFCSRLLRQHASFAGLKENYSILDIDDSRKVLGAAISEARVEDSMVTPDKLGNAISWAKNQLIGPADYPQAGSGIWKSVVERVYPIYQRRLLAANCVDFDDLLMHVALMLRDQPDLRRSLDNRYRQIMVDEYQDTNLAQYAIVRALSVDHPNLTVVGDPDQSIYGWRGANLSNILEFEHDYPRVKVVKLERNYRSTPNILESADALIRHNTKRKAKVLLTEREAGEPVRLVCCPAAQDEAYLVARRIAAEIHAKRRRPRDFAIAYRMNSLSRQFELALTQQRVPYQVVQGLEFFQRKEVKDLLSYLHLVNNPANDAAVLRIINTPVRGIGKTTVQKLADFAAANRLTLLEAARRRGSSLGLAARASFSLERFVELFDKLRKSATASIEQLLSEVIVATGYRAELERSKDPEDLDRVANIDELVTAAREFDLAHPGPAPLEAFLEQTALVADTDALETSQDKVTLMTLHAAKGLEFPVVYLVAMEDGILPHERSLDREDQLEEERRLVFVGITRAREEVNASCGRIRDYRGTRRISAPSVFLAEMTGAETVVSGDESPTGGVDSSFDPFGEAAADAAGWHEERTDPDAAGAPQLRVFRPDGLTMDRCDAQDDDPPPRRTRRETAADRAAGLAMRMAGLPTVAPAYATGQRVRHPEYGEGVLTKISGIGPRSVGTVAFDGPAGTRKFVLGQVKREPAE